MLGPNQFQTVILQSPTAPRHNSPPPQSRKVAVHHRAPGARRRPLHVAPKRHSAFATCQDISQIRAHYAQGYLGPRRHLGDFLPRHTGGRFMSPSGGTISPDVLWGKKVRPRRAYRIYPQTSFPKALFGEGHDEAKRRLGRIAYAWDSSCRCSGRKPFLHRPLLAFHRTLNVPHENQIAAPLGEFAGQRLDRLNGGLDLETSWAAKVGPPD